MTAQEKAKELIEKFDLPSGLMSTERKQCALIAAENVRTEMVKLKRYELAVYWRDVKREIRAL
jgi:hypothetical protein